MLKVEQVITPVDAIIWEIRHKIKQLSAIIGVIGLGPVGLPPAVATGKIGFKVNGFAINPQRVGKVRAGDKY